MAAATSIYRAEGEEVGGLSDYEPRGEEEEEEKTRKSRVVVYPEEEEEEEEDIIS